MQGGRENRVFWICLVKRGSVFLNLDIQQIIQKEYKRKLWPYNDYTITNQLISKYFDHNFIPIVFDEIEVVLCHLFNTNGDYIGKFNSVEDMKQYMQQEIINNYISGDIMRLY